LGDATSQQCEFTAMTPSTNLMRLIDTIQPTTIEPDIQLSLVRDVWKLPSLPLQNVSPMKVDLHSGEDKLSLGDQITDIPVAGQVLSVVGHIDREADRSEHIETRDAGVTTDSVEVFGKNLIDLQPQPDYPGQYDFVPSYTKCTDPTQEKGVGTSKLPLNFEELDSYPRGRLPSDWPMAYRKEDLIAAVLDARGELEMLETEYPSRVQERPLWYQEALEEENLIPVDQYLGFDEEYCRERDERRAEKTQARIEELQDILNIDHVTMDSSSHMEITDFITFSDTDITSGQREVGIQVQVPPVNHQIIIQRIAAVCNRPDKLPEGEELQHQIDMEASTCPHISCFGRCVRMMTNTYGLCEGWDCEKWKRVLELKIRQRQLLKLNGTEFEELCQQKALDQYHVAKERIKEPSPLD